MSHLPLLGGHDEPETLPYQINLFGPIGADPGQLGAGFRFLRSSVFARLTAKADHFIWMDVARRFLRYSAVNTRLDPAQKQVILSAPAKAREILVGQTLVPMFDAPFAVVFLGLVWFLGGHIVFGPLAIVAVSATAILVFLPGYIRNLSQLTDAEGATAAAFIGESLSENNKGLFGNGYALLSNSRRSQASVNVRVEAYNSFLLDVSQSASLLALVAILGVGAAAVLSGHLTTGGLAACTLLGSRGTIQAIGLFSAFARRQGARVAYRKIQALPNAQPQSTSPLQATGPLAVTGEVNGVSVSVTAGEIVVFDAGSSDETAKSMTELAMAIWGDDSNRKFSFHSGDAALDSDQVQHVSRFVVARPRLIEGTILDNISRYDSALEGDAYSLSQTIGLDPLTGTLALGYRTQVESTRLALPPGAIKRAALMRAFVGAPGLVLLERPGVGLDGDGIERLAGILRELSGVCTVVLTTEIDKLREAADRTIDVTGTLVDPAEGSK